MSSSDNVLKQIKESSDSYDLAIHNNNNCDESCCKNNFCKYILIGIILMFLIGLFIYLLKKSNSRRH